MSSLNKVMLIGHVGKDPELKFLPGGQAVTTFSLATSRQWKDKDGNKKEDTQWHNIKCWGKQAETAQKYLKKGKQIYVEGRIETREYERDGQKKYYTEIVMFDFKFLGKRDEAEPAMQPAGGGGDDLPF